MHEGDAGGAMQAGGGERVVQQQGTRRTFGLARGGRVGVHVEQAMAGRTMKEGGAMAMHEGTTTDRTLRRLPAHRATTTAAAVAAAAAGCTPCDVGRASQRVAKEEGGRLFSPPDGCSRGVCGGAVTLSFLPCCRRDGELGRGGLGGLGRRGARNRQRGLNGFSQQQAGWTMSEEEE